MAICATNPPKKRLPFKVPNSSLVWGRDHTSGDTFKMNLTGVTTTNQLYTNSASHAVPICIEDKEDDDKRSRIVVSELYNQTNTLIEGEHFFEFNVKPIEISGKNADYPIENYPEVSLKRYLFTL